MSPFKTFKLTNNVKMTQKFLTLFSFLSYLVFVEAVVKCTIGNHSTGICESRRACKQRMGDAAFEVYMMTDPRTCRYDDIISPLSSLYAVCCPTAVETKDCYTPEGMQGTCKDVNVCPVLSHLLKPPYSVRNTDYVKSHRCDEADENRVCCINCQRVVTPPHPQTLCCGIDKSGVGPDENRIVTSIYQFPWMALLEYIGPERDTKNIGVCAGTLISKRYVLTAAGCFNNLQTHHGAKPRNVLLGEYNTATEGPDCVATENGHRECTDGAIRVPIETVIPHEHFNYNTLLNNIALIRLEYNVPYTEFIRPICLPTADLDEDYYVFYVAGWGQTRGGVSLGENVKLQVDLPYVLFEECNKTYSDLIQERCALDLPLSKKQLCAGGEEGRGTCLGDGGGPLMLYNGQNYEIVGIVSYTHSCGLENLPDIFTKVYDYLPWIRGHIKP